MYYRKVTVLGAVLKLTRIHLKFFQRIRIEPRGILKFRLEIPKNWSDNLKINEAAGNTLWKDDAEKKVASHIHHKCFAFKSPSFKPLKEY